MIGVLPACTRFSPAHWPNNSYNHSKQPSRDLVDGPASCFLPQQHSINRKHHAGPSSSTLQQKRIPAAWQPRSANTPAAAAAVCAQHSPAGSSSRRLLSAAAWLCSISGRIQQQQRQPVTAAAAPAPQAQGAVLCRQKQQRRRWRAQIEAAKGAGGSHKQCG